MYKGVAKFKDAIAIIVTGDLPSHLKDYKSTCLSSLVVSFVGSSYSIITICNVFSS